MKNEIILYRPNELAEHIEVRLDDETVWLTQAQMVLLFDSTKQNISLHIRNTFKEGELIEDSVVKEILTTAADGKKYKTKFFNLDVIISVGYRVKSKRGTQFRIWANNILKEHLLKGHVVSHRLEKLESDMHEVKHKIGEIDLQIKTSLPKKQGIFFNGQIFDAWVFISDLVKSANKSLILVDNYVDESVLNLFLKRKDNVEVNIYTSNITATLKTDLEKHNKQYSPIEIKVFKNAHDRFLIIDQQHVYHIGASLKDLGKKLFAFSKMEIEANVIMRFLTTNKTA
jgi:hypothetical protein